MKYPIANFRPTEKNLNRLNMAKTLRLNVSEIINEVLERHMDVEIKKRAEKLQKDMERAKGFEPSTFTLATCSAGLKIIVRAGTMAPDVITKVRDRGALSHSPDHRGNENSPAAAPASNWGLRKRLNFAVP